MDELAALIRSMSWAEKRYFRKYARRHEIGEENRYLRLFRELEQLPEGAPVASTPLHNREAALRSYLQKLVLRALREYHHQDTIEMELRCLLDYIDLVQKRWLPKMQMRMIRKGIARSRAAGLPQFELEFQRRLRKVIRTDRRPEQGERLEVVTDEEQRAIAEFGAELSWLQRYDKFYLEAQVAPEMSDGGLAPLSGTDEAPHSFNGALAFYTTQAMHALRRQDHMDARKFFGLNLDVWEQFPAQIRDHPRRYVGAVINYLSSCHRVSDYAEFDRIVAKIEAQPQVSVMTRRIVQLKVAELAMMLHLATLDLERALESAARCRQLLRSHKFDPTLVVTTSWNLAMLDFLRSDYVASLQWINRILNLPRGKSREDLVAAARIFEVVLHYERGNDDYMLSRIRSLERVRHPAVAADWVRALFKCLRKCITLYQPRDRRREFALLHAQLEAVPDTGRSAGLNELIVWCNHHANDRPVADLLREPPEI